MPQEVLRPTPQHEKSSFQARASPQPSVGARPHARSTCLPTLPMQHTYILMGYGLCMHACKPGPFCGSLAMCGVHAPWAYAGGACALLSSMLRHRCVRYLPAEGIRAEAGTYLTPNLSAVHTHPGLWHPPAQHTLRDAEHACPPAQGTAPAYSRHALLRVHACMRPKGTCSPCSRSCAPNRPPGALPASSECSARGGRSGGRAPTGTFGSPWRRTGTPQCPRPPGGPSPAPPSQTGPCTCPAADRTSACNRS